MTVIFHGKHGVTSLDLGDGEIGECIDFSNGYACFSLSTDNGAIDYEIPCEDMLSIVR